MQVSFSADDIAAIVQPTARRGTTRATIRGLAALRDAAAGDLSFLGNKKYRDDVSATRASVVLLPSEYAGDPQPDQLFLVVDNPSVALARVCARIEQMLWPKPPPGIHPSAVVDSTAKIDGSATIGPNCVIEAGASVGARTHLQANVFVGRNATVGSDGWFMPGVVIAAESVIGHRVRLQPGAVIGSDGFGYEFVNGRHEKVPQVGNVVIGDDVEVGANTTIDRARFSRTFIGEGTKIDNLVQIAHNVVIGQHCVIVAQAGISGSTTLEDYVVLGGQAGVAGHLRLGKGTKVGAQSGINGDTGPGAFMNGTPAVAYTLERRLVILYRRLPEIFKRVDELERHVRDAK